MDEKITALKEKQQQLGEKINQLNEINKRKDEEASAIRDLIAECKDNLNRIREVAVFSEASTKSQHCPDATYTSIQTTPCKNIDWPKGDTNCPPKDAPDAERVTCKVDLGRMKVRIRGPSEDLKQLDAAQLINLLDKFQCQELIINTGEEIVQNETDYFGAKASFHNEGEVPIFYLMHPGNIAMLAGIIMVALLINANLCNPKRSCKMKLLLNVLYLGSFAFHYGMVLWMSFIRGHSLSTGLTHDTFNMVDNLILPKYYSICVFLSALTLYSFLASHCAAPCTSWPVDVMVQVIVGVATFFLELATISYVVPAIIKIRDATDDFIGEESEGTLPEGYENNIKKLNKLNWTISVVNMLTVMFMGANMYYISAKLNIG